MKCFIHKYVFMIVGTKWSEYIRFFFKICGVFNFYSPTLIYISLFYDISKYGYQN